MKRLLFVFLALLAPQLDAQGPEADWRTFSTPHFRIHFTAPAEAWAERLAQRLESIRSRVSDEIGFEPSETVDVLVMDPFAQPNGSAWPLLGWPRILLWTTPPGPDSVIGYYRDWGETLMIHEDAHLVHLLRPSRNPKQRALSRLIPLGPISKRAPRWVSEGYATVVEGALTGQGRPNSDLRATILRRWAQQGELPSYNRLSSDGQSWRGMSMAYLVGSAFLEWLAERAGPDSLKNLWARMTARQDRSFEEAFAGTFGAPPRKLYNRFCAELTYRAMELEQKRQPLLQNGDLWQDLAWTSGPPAVSPDGKWLALVLRGRNQPSRLVVWSADNNEEGTAEWEEMRQKMLDQDPEDIPAVEAAVFPLPRKPAYQLITTNGKEPYTPRWAADGQSLLFVRFEPDANGFLHPDLFRWTIDLGSAEEGKAKTGWVERITRGADVRDPDPAPGGDWAVAVRHRHGLSQLVAVDLVSGAVSNLTEPSLKVTYSHPRINPDGQRLAFVQHREGEWRLIVRGLAGRSLEATEATLPTPPRSTVAYPAWSQSGNTLLATVGQEGFLEISAWYPDSQEPHAAQQLTYSHGASLAPAPTADGVFFLGLEPDGLDLRFLKSPLDIPPPPVSLPRKLAESEKELYAPAVRPEAPPPVPPLDKAETTAAKPYGFGRQEFFPLLGGTSSSHQDQLEIGLRGGDLLGRIEYLALASFSDSDGLSGGALTASWRASPVSWNIHWMNIEETLATPDGLFSEKGKIEGAELSAHWNRHSRAGTLQLGAGLFFSSEESSNNETLNRRLAFVDARKSFRQSIGPWRLDQSVNLSLEVGNTESHDWQRFGTRTEVGFGRRSGHRLGLVWQRRTSEDLILNADRFQLGGVRSSLLPRSSLAGRILVPALPRFTAIGDEYEGQKVHMNLGQLPVSFFYERHRLWNENQSRGDWLALAGLELRWARPAWPLLRLPAFELRTGLAEILDPLPEDHLQWWFTLNWQP